MRPSSPPLLPLTLALLVSACTSPPPPRPDAAPRCLTADDCSDALFCNGDERCMPADPAADSLGCIAAAAPPCDAADTCDEDTDTCGCATPDDDGDGDPSIACGGDDCDDADPLRASTLPEVCDAADLDEDCDPATLGFRDRDADGFVDAACCNAGSCADDCDDTRARVRPGATELCDGIDDDCDGDADDGVLLAFHPDADGDGHGDPTAVTVSACTPPPGHVLDATDCDDARAARRPSAPEICDAIDDDCDGNVDEGVAGMAVFPDCDGDLHGAPGATPVVCPSTPPAACTTSGAGWAGADDDCDDTLRAVHPGAIDACDAIDGDCDGTIDEASAADAWCSDPARRAPGTTAATCVSGACVSGACEAGLLDCDAAATRGCEIDGATDPDHCGACDRACAWGACRAGACEPSGLALSDGYGGCALRGATVYCWGDEATTGAPTAGDRAAPTLPIPVLTTAVEIAMGGRFGCARVRTGAVGCWGVTPAGACGGACSRPLDVGASGALELAAARGVSEAPTVCWRSSPSRVECADGAVIDLGGSVVEILAAEARGTGARIVCGRREDGTVTCGAWSGTPDVALRDVPGLDDAVSIDAYGLRACAARESGAVACWLLEDPRSGPAWSLVPAAGTTGAVEVAVGNAHACLRRADGTVACWGANAHGQCGDGATSAMRDRPVEVVGISSARTIVAGNAASCALLATGPVCWGDTMRGALGGGRTSGDVTTPAPVLPPP